MHSRFPVLEYQRLLQMAVFDLALTQQEANALLRVFRSRTPVPDSLHSAASRMWLWQMPADPTLH